MSSARSKILGRIRLATATQVADAAYIAAEAAALLPDPTATRPAFEEFSIREKFVERATSERLTATVDEIDDWSAATDTVHNYLKKNNIPLRIALQPKELLANLNWADVEHHEQIAPNELAAVGVADYGIAETGTLVFTSKPDSPTLFNFLGLHHIVLVESKNLLRYMEDYWIIVRENGNVQPRNINFVTGTSGTADIESKNTRGAHGPRFLHIIIVGQ